MARTALSVVLLLGILVCVNGWCFPWEKACKRREAEEAEAERRREELRKYEEFKNSISKLERSGQTTEKQMENRELSHLSQSFSKFEFLDLSKLNSSSPSRPIFLDNFEKKWSTFKNTVDLTFTENVDPYLGQYFDYKLGRLEMYLNEKMKMYYDYIKIT